MLKATFFTIYLTFIVFCEVKSQKNCDDLGTILYEDIGCKAITKDGQDCPIKYECDDFTTSKDSCLFRGRNYALNQQIDNNITYDSCNVACFCNNRNEGASLESEETKDSIISTKNFLSELCRATSRNKIDATFTCAILDCPEWLGSPIKPGCYRKYEVDKCCSVGMNCPSEDNELGECKVDGKVYKEGEKFFPKNTCMKCACPKNFNGKIETPHCKRISCGVQINHAEELYKKCAPFYLKSNDGKLCCPDSWICTSSSDKIIKAENTESNSELTCVFGTNVLNLGEGIEREINLYGSNRKAKCECILPPLLTCKEI